VASKETGLIAGAGPGLAAAVRLEIGDRLGEVGMFDERGEAVIFRLGRYLGRPIVLFACRDPLAPQVKRHLTALQAIAKDVEGLDACLCAISPRSPADHLPLAREMNLSFPLLNDPSNKVLPALGLPQGNVPMTVVIDSHQRILGRIGPADIADHAGEALAILKAHLAEEAESVVEAQAPVLMLPRVLSPALCTAMIDRWAREPHVKNRVSEYGKQGSVESDNKRREDFFLPYEDPDSRQLFDILSKRLYPEIRRAFFFDVTRSEELRIGGYNAKDLGMFRRHHDNRHRATAHRRYALSLNLNSEFEGGEVIFPEYSRKRYRPPPGAALVFSCSLLHEALPVTKGCRMALFTFFFGEAEEKYRQSLEGETARRGG
jgi:peroxiredoxin/predicted 2-oxoglutarate/Fe(II)-dependent dioxygenase YbiX